MWDLIDRDQKREACQEGLGGGQCERAKRRDRLEQQSDR